jgi:hypothetical protein
MLKYFRRKRTGSAVKACFRAADKKLEHFLAARCGGDWKNEQVRKNAQEQGRRPWTMPVRLQACLIAWARPT